MVHLSNPALLQGHRTNMNGPCMVRSSYYIRIRILLLIPIGAWLPPCSVYKRMNTILYGDHLCLADYILLAEDLEFKT